MDGVIVVAVLTAALLHACWNLIVKQSGDRLVGIAMVSISQGLIATPLLYFFDFPAVESWPYLVASIILHFGYQIFLAHAYTHGDLSQVYPIARGSAPLMTFLGTMFFVGEPISSVAAGGVVILSLGIISLALIKGADALHNWTAIGYALGTALFIACYTVVDGLGARLSGSAHGYALWLFALDSIPMIATILLLRKRAFMAAVKQSLPRALGGGAMSLGAYWIVIWAMTQAPIAPVAALRETSVLFGTLMGTWILKEGRGRARLAAAAVVACGIVLVRS